jgi:hypothetical protein
MRTEQRSDSQELGVCLNKTTAELEGGNNDQVNDERPFSAISAFWGAHFFLSMK